MEVQSIRIKDLEMNTGQIDGLPSNPRQWTKDEMDNLKKSISETPELLEARGAIVYPKDGKYIVLGGNMRLEAVRALGWKEMPCIVLPESLPVGKLKEIVIKDNGSFGEWDMDALANAWDDLPLSEWGANVLWEGENVEEKEVKEDNFTEEDMDKAEPIVADGDLWQLGENILLCGDSTDGQNVQKLMGGESADIYITDPPYNVNYEGGTKDRLKKMNDSMDDSSFRRFLVDAFRAVDPCLKPGGVIYIWHSDTESLNFRMAMMDTGWLLKQCLIWVKNALVLGRQDYQWKHEPCLYGWKDGAAHYFTEDRTNCTVFEDKVDLKKLKKDEMLHLLEEVMRDSIPTTVIHEDKPLRNAEHPTMKPVRLIGNLIRNSSRKGEIILDTFGGSGTTMIACEQLGRKCRMMELDPHYCDVIIARWEKLTGRKAEKME